MCLHNFSGAFFFKFFYLISQQFLSKKNFFLLICNPLLVMCIWYKCSILLMIFIFWSIHGYYIRKEKTLCFSGVCQPNQKLFIDYLPVWGNSNLIFSQCLWCISSYGCWLLWALCLAKSLLVLIYILCNKAFMACNGSFTILCIHLQCLLDSTSNCRKIYCNLQGNSLKGIENKTIRR